MTSEPGASPARAPVVCFTFDVDAEEVWLAEQPGSARRPVVLSHGYFGPRVGVPAILDVLAAYDVRASFFVPGRVAQNYPACVERILEAGHEIAHHGYTHRMPTALSREEEVDELGRSIAALRTFGIEPAGYRAPSWEFSEHTLGLIEEHGFRYSSNFMTDIRPFRHEGSSIVEVPVHWILDDAAHFWFSADTWTKKISTNSEVDEIFSAESRGIARMGGVTVYTFHPQIIGRPGRLELLEGTLARSLDDSQAVVTTVLAVADAARARTESP